MGEVLALCQEKVNTASLGGLGPMNQAPLVSCIQQLHTGTGTLSWSQGVCNQTCLGLCACRLCSAQLRPRNSFLFSFSSELQNPECILLNSKMTFIL